MRAFTRAEQHLRGGGGTFINETEVFTVAQSLRRYHSHYLRGALVCRLAELNQTNQKQTG
jgi:hypothetical protein